MSHSSIILNWILTILLVIVCAYNFVTNNKLATQIASLEAQQTKTALPKTTQTSSNEQVIDAEVSSQSLIENSADVAFEPPTSSKEEIEARNQQESDQLRTFEKESERNRSQIESLLKEITQP